MELTVLGGAGAWPPAGGACSGYLIEHDGSRLLVDPGYATLPRLLELVAAEAIDAVLVGHGHPDHVADLNPLLRARALREDPAPALPTYALPGALCAVLALDRPGMLDHACDLRELNPGDAGPTDDLVELARGTDLLVAEATYVERVPDDTVAGLNSALEVGWQASRAGAARLLLTHLQPGTDPDASRDAARRAYQEWIGVATGGMVVDLS